jgi:hypothetical protein
LSGIGVIAAHDSRSSTAFSRALSRDGIATSGIRRVGASGSEIRDKLLERILGRLNQKGILKAV